MLLDTNAYSALARGIPSMMELIDEAQYIVLPLPVIAELRYGFMKGSQIERNEQQLQRFLAQPQVTILIPTVKTTQYYAELQLMCRQKGKALSQNDIWIAALAHESGNTLITFDKDFIVFSEIFEDKLCVLN